MSKHVTRGPTPDAVFLSAIVCEFLRILSAWLANKAATGITYEQAAVFRGMCKIFSNFLPFDELLGANAATKRNVTIAHSALGRISTWKRCQSLVMAVTMKVMISTEMVEARPTPYPKDFFIPSHSLNSEPDTIIKDDEVEINTIYFNVSRLPKH